MNSVRRELIARGLMATAMVLIIVAEAIKPGIVPRKVLSRR